MCCLCSCWQHASCSKISDSNYDSITKLGSLVMWFCDADKRKLKSLAIAEDNSREDTLLKGLEEVSSKLHDIEKKIGSSQPTFSYAEVVIGAKNPAPTHFGMVIKPRDAISSSETEKTVRSALNLMKINTGVTKLKHVNSGGVFLGARNEDDLKKLELEAANVLGNNFQVYVPKPRHPKVVIRGIDKEYNYENLVEEIKQTNPGFDTEDSIKVVHHRQTKDRNETKWMYFLEVNGRTFRKIVDKHLNIDFNSYIVREFVDVLRCFKCQQYGHKSNSCNSDVRCGNCGGPHEFRSCSASVSQCFNCISWNDKNKTNLSSDHSCGSWKCHQQIDMIKKQKEKINYDV